MIRVRRPSTVPAVLAKEGRRLRKALCQAHSRGACEFTFDRTVYGHEDVKQALRTAQFGKCCFCEAKLAHITAGDVEHFRPKAGFRDHNDGPLRQPGYFWLAYEWSNLLLSCERCNRRHKKNYFPLRRPTRRARSHKHDLAREEPLLIDPATEDPEAAITFRGEYPRPVSGSRAGRETIAALGLDREALNEHRREALARMKALFRIAYEVSPSTPKLRQIQQEARALLARATDDRAEYASMMRCALRAWRTRAAP